MEPRKLIKLKNENKEIEIREMSCAEVYEQFKRMVYSTALRFNNSSETIEDLVQIGNLGLIKSYNHYDIDTGNLFMTFLTKVITNDFLMQIRKERRPTRAQNAISLYEELAIDFEGNSLTILDILQEPLECEDIILKKYAEIELRKFIKELKPRQMRIVEMFYFERMEQRVIANILNCSQSYVSRLLRRSVEVLKRRYKKLEEREVS